MKQRHCPDDDKNITMLLDQKNLGKLPLVLMINNVLIFIMSSVPGPKVGELRVFLSEGGVCVFVGGGHKSLQPGSLLAALYGS